MRTSILIKSHRRKPSERRVQCCNRNIPRIDENRMSMVTDARSSSTTLCIFTSFLPCKTRLKPRLSSSAAVALPIPSVDPLTMVHGPFPCR